MYSALDRILELCCMYIHLYWCAKERSKGSPASTVVIIISAPMAADLTSVAAPATSSASIDTPLFCNETRRGWNGGNDLKFSPRR